MFLRSVHKKILLAVILDYKLFQMCLFKSAVFEAGTLDATYNLRITQQNLLGTGVNTYIPVRLFRSKLKLPTYCKFFYFSLFILSTLLTILVILIPKFSSTTTTSPSAICFPFTSISTGSSASLSNSINEPVPKFKIS